MNPLKVALKRALDRTGFEVHRVRRGTPPRPPARRRVVNAHYRGRCFKCFYGDYLGRSILTGRGWDNNLENILDGIHARHPAGDVIEIGANIGASLIPIAAKYERFHFHCVEPVSAFFALLRENAATFDAINATLYNVAVSSSDGERITIHTQIGSAGALAQYDAHTPVGSVEVEARTVDALFSTCDVRFFKVDVDGFELAVLEGARQTLSRCRPVCFIEFHTKLMRRMGVDPADVIGLFASLGYDSITVYSSAGERLAVTSSPQEVLAMADSAKYYVDILAEHSRPRT